MFNGIVDWLKEMIIETILAVFNGFSGGSITDSAHLLGQSSSEFSFPALSMASNISENVVLPVAGVVLTYVAVTELIVLVTEHNNMYEHSTYTIMKWMFKTSIAVFLVSNAFTIVNALIEVGAELVIDSVPYVTGEEGTYLQDMTDTLMELAVGELLAVLLATLIASLVMMFIKILVSVIILTRFFEIYMTTAVATIPMATLTSDKWGNSGVNYLRTVLALALQGIIIIIALAVYGAINASQIVVDANPVIGSVSGIIQGVLRPLILGLALLLVVIKSKSLAQSIIGAN